MLEKKWGPRIVRKCQGRLVIACMCERGYAEEGECNHPGLCCYLTLRFPPRITFLLFGLLLIFLSVGQNMLRPTHTHTHSRWNWEENTAIKHICRGRTYGVLQVNKRPGKEKQACFLFFMLEENSHMLLPPLFIFLMV